MKSTQQTKEIPAGDVFEVQKVRRFAQIMKDYGLAELEIQDGEVHIRMSRGGAAVCVPAQEIAAVSSIPAAVPAAPAPAVSAPAPAAEEDANIQVIKSPIVGTFYSKPNPNSKPFVNVGDVIAEGKTVCIIEAMKVMNQLPADVSGKIVAILAKDGAPVEFGQPLFKVDVRG
ncbi:MAG: acetyl-CoA carboxylase biotin carboxyl carrier protein [Thermoguttaceae bacterium]|nr:acetyl-CoA carboxylase biotin carboxyl carrier protein [Planctomycetaceae bacterium]MBQ4144001.1 acetyl-CoA carboxylase biotin carboxyl carrier protein [Thermoguttaceae bacterium]